MKICLDARSPYGGGITTYTQELLKNLMAIPNEHQYVILYDSNHGMKGFVNADERIAPSSNVAWRLVWDHTFLPHLLKEEKVDIYHSFKPISSFNSHTKLIYTIHFAGVYQYPNLLGYKHFYVHGWMLRRLAKSAGCFIALSEADKAYFADWFGAKREKIKITYLAADERFCKIDDERMKERTRVKYNLPKKFVLYVGIPHPIKNVHTLIKAYSMARHDFKIPQKLVIVGRPNVTSYHDQLLRLVKDLNIQDDVLFPGYIKDELPVIYNLADLFVCPSLYENFPLPPMEAIACGTPVIASRVGGIPEIYGDAVVPIDPRDTTGLAEAMVRVLSCDPMRGELSQRGLKRSKLFSWKRCASETLKIYEEVSDA
jgi:glycosyltransferase involved in cell wall biosynthesis